MCVKRIFIQKIGTLYGFSDEFIHFIKLEFPFSSINLFIDEEEKVCDQFLEAIPVLSGSADDNMKLQDILNRTCIQFDQSLSEFSNRLKITANLALEDYRGIKDK